MNRGQVERRADGGAFGARAIVAADVDDQRVVELAQVFHCLDHAANFMVGIGHIGGEYLRLAGEQLLLIGVERIPLRQDIRPGSELRIRRDDAEPLLVGENLLAQIVPAHVELAVELLDPFRRRLMRRMRAAGHVIEEERLVRRSGIQLLHVLDRLVRHIGGQVVAGLPDPRKDLGMIAEEIGRPLVGLTAHEPIEILEAHPDWAIGRKGPARLY